MKSLRKSILVSAALLMAVLCSSSALSAAAQGDTKQLKIAIVNFKQVVEQSKLGKQEQNSFEALRKQMEATLEDKEKALNEIAAKFNDPDYLDSLAPEAENELKHKFRALNQEISQQQNQYYQALNQANVKILQKLAEAVSKATETIAKEQNIDLVANEDGCFYYSSALDISPQVVAIMDKQYDKEISETPKALKP